MKIFSVEEAEELLPLLKTSFERAFSLNQTLKTVSADIDSLVDIWGEDVYRSGHTDNGYYMRLASRQQELMSQLQEELKKINSLGCFVKDVERGLVDFHCYMNGELVFLCWKYGEERISYWHSLNGGFTGRRPLGTIAFQKR